MIIISISKRKLKFFAAAVLAVFLVSFGIYQIFGNQDTENYFELVNMLRCRDVAASGEILEETAPASESSDEVQIFDIGKGKVVKRMKATPMIQEQARKIIGSITGMYAKIQPFPDKGYIVKIPVNPALKVQSQYINASVDRIYVIFTDKEPPIVLILDSSDKPFVYNFGWKTDELEKQLGFKFVY
ncbi:MAG: hypothetical protein GX027_04205 [Clostridiaceae bacterium]|jgi:hypothetical protein|nr:hypothetical protein [Clostridiaceae bacterium]